MHLNMRTRAARLLLSSSPRLVLSAVLWLHFTSGSWAIIADPNPFEWAQPDGLKIKLRVRGDEFFHWYEDMDGFTVLLQGREYVYARLDLQNQLVPTTWAVGRVNPRAVGLAANLLPSGPRPLNRNDRLISYRPWVSKGGGVGKEVAARGTVTNLVILCKFTNHTFGIHTRLQANYDTLFNHQGSVSGIAPTGSVRDAYLENSYGILDLQSTVLAWVTLPQNESYYAGTNHGLGNDYPNNAQKMVEDALALVDPMVDFGQFDSDNDGFVDAIDFIHSGYGAESGGAGVWSHRWGLPHNWISADNNGAGVKVKVQPYHTEPALFGTSGTEITRIGVIVHETGHFFGLPDLYDTDNGSAGIGSWCMMANSWGFDNDQLHPPHFSAWCKLLLGWATPTMFSSPGVYAPKQAETFPSIGKITSGFPANEYLLIENRQPVGLDSRIPQGGLAIWHVDDNQGDNNSEGFPGQSGWPANGLHYRVALLQADGKYDLEKNANQGDAGDLYHGGRRLAPFTVPNSDAYQGGVISSTQIEISNTSDAAPVMAFYFGLSPVIFVDRSYMGGTSDGSLARPFTTVREGYNAALDGYAIFTRGNNYHEAPFAMTKRLLLDSYDGPCTIGP